jgi:hypothetical protein
MARRCRSAPLGALRATLLLLAAVAAAEQSPSEACAWNDAGEGGAAPCGADTAAALLALGAQLDAASARITADRAALDAAAARVDALRASLGGCPCAADAAPSPLFAAAAGDAAASSPLLLVPADGAATAALAPATSALALQDGGAARSWAHRLTLAARPPPGWGARLPLLAALRVLPPAHASALLTLPPDPVGGAAPRFIAVGGAFRLCLRACAAFRRADTRMSRRARLAGSAVHIHAGRGAAG